MGTRVVIAGGGVAALETLIGLRARARTPYDVTVVAPQPDFVMRPLEISEPFGYERPRRYPLADLVEGNGARLVPGAVARVVADEQVAVLDSGRRVSYDIIVLAVGARAVPAFEHGVLFDRRDDAAAFDDALGDLGAGLAGGMAVVVPPGAGWTLPAYELALATARWGRERGLEQLPVTLVTAEARPLDAFGGRASAEVARILAEAGVRVMAGAIAQVESDTALRAGRGGRWLTADRIVSLPLAAGPAIPGVPADGRGFVPADEHGRVPGLERVYAAGDGTAGRIKQGGLAAQQADAVVEDIAGRTRGDTVSPAPRVLRGLLRTADGPRYLRAALDDPEGTSAISRVPLWWPPSRIASVWLSPELERLDAGATAQAGAD
jgi:sulfide:quinone oxidoreductase